MTSQIQNLVRSALRPIARFARRILTPPEPPVVFDWHQINAGPARGAELILPSNAAITERIVDGGYEQQVLAFVSALVKQDEVCFDIGGHYGYYTLCLANLAPRGQVHTFEPVSTLAKRIRQAADRSGLGHVTVHQAAVAGEIGEMDLYYDQSGQGDDSMAYLDAYGGVDTEAAHEHYRSFSRTKVQSVTLDSLVNQLPAPSFIKMDAEGAEAAILRGGLNLVRRFRPRLLIEIHGIHEALQCAEILSRVGYRALLLTDQKKTMPILWVANDDDDAVASVRTVLGHDPMMLFATGHPSLESTESATSNDLSS
jgi:FkbM family methyltransferase